MTLEEIKELIITIDKSNIALFEFTNKDLSITMDKSLQRNISKSEINQSSAIEKAQEIMPMEDNKSKEDAFKQEKKIKELSSQENYEIIKSPMVGTFYNAPSPDKQPFCSVGDKVSKGKTLCIIEAMKLMNEIESPFDGEVMEVLVENASMVEYGEPLFKIRK